ncbi:MAG: diguanylate cyclase [Anaerolineales bacterium]|nr:diguanylate cyclase [Anaerolineales bacterium]
MLNRPDIYVPLIYLVAAIPYAWLGLYAWRRRPAIAVTSFAQVMLGMSIWTTAYSLELFSSSIPAKIFFTQIEYIGVAVAPLAMFFFAIEFTGKRHVLSTSKKLLISIIPAISVALVWTNQFHHLMWDNEVLTNVGSLILLHLDFGIFFWIHTVYTYGLLIIANIILIMEFIQRPSVYRVQISFLILSILFPLIGSFFYVTGSGLIQNLDVTPLFFLPTALGLAWAIVKYRLLEILPLEHIHVLESMKDSVIVLNPQQRVLYINQTAEYLLNSTEDKAIGQPFEEISKTYAEKLIPYLTNEEIQTEVTVGEGKQVRVYELSVSSISPVDVSQKPNHQDKMMVLHDITQRKETELALSRRELIMSAISMAAEQFLRASTWEHNIPGVLEKIGQAADVSRVSVVMNYTDENRVIHSSLCYEWASPSVKPQINNPSLRHVPLRKSGLGRWEDWLSQGLPIDGIVKNLPQEEQEFYKGRESLSIVVVPIFVDFQWWGFILFDECRYERIWTSTELEAFHIAASIFGAAETRARTEQKLMHRQRTLGLLQDIVKVSLKASDVKDMAQTIVERLGELINANGCFLTLWDEASKRPMPIAAYGPQKDIYTSIQPKPAERTFTELVLEAGHTLVIEDAAKDANIYQQPTHTQSILVLPLIAEEKKLGAVIMTFNQSHKFSADEISICEQASALIALALEKFQVVDEAKRRADTSEILRKASLAVAEKLEMDETATHILEQLKQVLPYDSASVQLYKDNELHIVGGLGWPDDVEVLGVRFPVPGDNPNTIVLETGKPYSLTDAWKKYSAFREPPANGIVSWLGVPLIVQNKTVGLLAIDSYQPNRFSEADIKIATEFANQVAIALENARIYQETQAQAITDPLTNIYNRRGLFQLGEFEFQRARRIHRPFSVMMFDIDHFKRINDQYSHAIGDQILQRFTERCQKNLRAIDLLGRYGGEEFVILLPETNLQAAQVIAERLRQSIMNAPFTSDAGDLRITTSIGVAEAHQNETLNNLVQRADAALYKAKDSGRNRVVVDETQA